MNDMVLLQISHPFTHVLAHAQESLLGEAASLGPEVNGQTAVLHELEHQAHGGLLHAHPEQLHQLGMRQFPAGEVGAEEQRPTLSFAVLGESVTQTWPGQYTIAAFVGTTASLLCWPLASLAGDESQAEKHKRGSL